VEASGTLNFLFMKRSIWFNGIFIANIGHLSLFPSLWPFSNSNLPQCISWTKLTRHSTFRTRNTLDNFSAQDSRVPNSSSCHWKKAYSPTRMFSSEHGSETGRQLWRERRRGQRRRSMRIMEMRKRTNGIRGGVDVLPVVDRLGVETVISDNYFRVHIAVLVV